MLYDVSNEFDYILQKFAPCFAEGSTGAVAVVAGAEATKEATTTATRGEAPGEAAAAVEAGDLVARKSSAVTDYLFTFICTYNAY